MRNRMNDVESYVPPFELGAPLDGGAVGGVLEARDPALGAGDVVLHGLGWRDHALAPAKQARKIDTSIAPPQAYLGVLGMPGLTAYAGLVDVAGLREGDVVFVSGAAGAGGGVVGEIAKLRGHPGIGRAGPPGKGGDPARGLGFGGVVNLPH